ncbi:MAG TPA: murein biosynthesis integral membrane protein MurJ [Thermomicrobiales bacterium]|nr:murein biosynthesis integral membrane protein MurJ [Thermomicrobiales bacterium]
MSQARQLAGSTAPRERDTAAERSTEASPGARSLARSAIIVSLAFVLSRVLGLVREVVLANQFGTTSEMDAYVSAFRIPDLLFLVVIAGSFGAAFIPIFGDFLTRGDEERAWRLASAVLTWAGLVMLALSLLTFVLARPLMMVVAPGFDDETTDLAVELMRILLLSPIFLGTGIAFKGILEAQHQFTLPALAPLVYNASIIVGAVAFAPTYGIHAVGWAVIAGAVGHMLIQLPGVLRSGLVFTPTISRQVEGLVDVARLLGPRIVGLAAFQVNFIAINAFASTTSDEHVSALNYAWQLLMLPHGVLALSISTVIFPTLAALYSQGRTEEFRATLDRTLRPLLFLSIPAGIGLYLVREPIVRLIYQSGTFDENSTDLVATPLAFFALGLVGYALTEILTRVFYATRDTRTPVVTGVLTVALNLLLASLLIDSLSHAGLALALSVTTGAEAVILWLFLRQRAGGVVSSTFAPWLLRVLLATTVMALLIWLTIETVLEVQTDKEIPLLMREAFFVYALGMYMLAFVVAAWLLRIPELLQITSKAAARLPAPLRGRLPGHIGP